MRNDYREYSPIRTFLFIMFCALLVIGVDLFAYDGKYIIHRHFEQKTVMYYADINALQDRHELYMRDGILPPRSSRLPPSEFQQANIDKEIAPFTPIPLFDVPPEVAAQPKKMEDVSEEHVEISTQDLLQNVEPASGVDAAELDLSVINIPSAQTAPVPENEIEIAMEIPEITPSFIPGPKAVQDVPKLAQTVVLGERPRVAIIIDDMGLTLRSRQVEVMTAPLTLAYLPYAENLRERTKIAKKNGHELMVHLPMEAMNGGDGGPRVLEVSDNDQEFRENVEWGLSQFEGYVGLNNHMGSRLTSDPDAMKKLMGMIKDKNIYFVDSKTIGSSVAEQTASQFGIAHAGRDVFLDHEISRAFVDQALSNLEAIARDKGYAIAIGHPHKETIEALKDWLPTLEAKGIELVPVSALVNKSHKPVESTLLVAHEVADEHSSEPSSDSLQSVDNLPVIEE